MICSEKAACSQTVETIGIAPSLVRLVATGAIVAAVSVCRCCPFDKRGRRGHEAKKKSQAQSGIQMRSYSGGELRNKSQVAILQSSSLADPALMANFDVGQVTYNVHT